VSRSLEASIRESIAVVEAAIDLTSRRIAEYEQAPDEYAADLHFMRRIDANMRLNLGWGHRLLAQAQALAPTREREHMARKKNKAWDQVYKDDGIEIRIDPTRRRVSVAFDGDNACLDHVRHSRGVRGDKSIYSFFQMTAESSTPSN
jgi:hypothetical protein